MDQPNTPTHDECARLARQQWEDEQDPKRKAFLGQVAQMWAELAAVKKLEKEVAEGDAAAQTSQDTQRLVG